LIKEKGLGRYRVGGNEYTHEEAGRQHQTDLYLLLGFCIQVSQQRLKHPINLYDNYEKKKTGQSTSPNLE
jgi:hypothetical protein